MKYAIHSKNPDGSLNDSLVHTTDNLASPPTTSPWFNTEGVADVWLLEELRLNKLPGEYSDYSIQPHDDQGIMLEKVEKNAQEAAAADAKWLASNLDDVNLAVSAMLTSRQMYAVAVKELERIVEKVVRVNGEIRKPHPLALEVLLQAASAQASKPFNENDLFAGLSNVVIPWFHKVVSAHVKDDREAEVKANDEEEKSRRACPVPIAFCVERGFDGTLDRAKPIILVGYGPAVRFLLDRAVNAALGCRSEQQPDRKFTVLRFADTVPVLPASEATPKLLRIPRNEWVYCCRTKKTLQPLVVEFVLPWMRQIQCNPDLLVVDDLAACVEGLMVAVDKAGGLSPWRAADAYKRLEEWCNHAGMGLLAGIPCDQKQPLALNASEWERLRAHAILRPVSVLETAPDLAEGKVRIVVGRDAWQTDVDAAVLEVPSSIIQN